MRLVYKTLITLITLRNSKKFFDQGVHDHHVLVDLVHIPGGKMQISPKLELYRANQDQIRNQRPRLRRNRLFLGRKEGGVFPTSAEFSTNCGHCNMRTERYKSKGEQSALE